MPGNRALAYSDKIDYIAVKITKVLESSIASIEEVIIVGETWPQEFTFSDIGKVFQEGFDRSNGSPNA